MAVDNADSLGGNRACGIQDVRKKRAAGQLGKNFGQVGIHSLALASGQDDNVRQSEFPWEAVSHRILARRYSTR
jgi:hypothetical protein